MNEATETPGTQRYRLRSQLLKCIIGHHLHMTSNTMQQFVTLSSMFLYATSTFGTIFKFILIMYYQGHTSRSH